MKVPKNLNELKAFLEKCGIALINDNGKLIIANGEKARLVIHKKNGVRRRVTIKILSRKPIDLVKIGLDANLGKEGIEIVLSR